MSFHSSNTIAAMALKTQMEIAGAEYGKVDMLSMVAL